MESVIAEPATQNQRIYCNCMEEIKARFNLIVAFFNQDRSTGSVVTDAEFACLQFRKILELIALASIAPNKGKYAELRDSFAKDWNATYILNDLEKVNPDFYPLPVEQTKSERPGVNWHFENVTNPFLSKSDFQRIYKRCGGLLHAANPFGQPKDVASVRNEFQDWASKIETLLRTHRIRLIDGSVWIIVMQDPHDGKVRAFVGEPTP